MPKGPFKRTLKWKPGDIFAVPLSDRSFGYAQAIAPVASFAIDFALLCERTKALPNVYGPVARLSAIAILATWRTVITGGHWAKVGSAETCLPTTMCRNQQLLASSLAGVQHSSWGLLEDFLSAYHGLVPWNLYPAFSFDSYLLAGTPRPPVAKVLDAASLELFRAADKQRVYSA
jgi:hypothetical protein